MTAVASPPSFANLNRPGWINGGQPLNSMNPSDDGRGGLSMFMQRKTLPRTNSSSSVSSTSSNSSTSTVTSSASSQQNDYAAAGSANGWSNPAPRKRPTAKGPWANGKADAATDFSRAASGRATMTNGVNGASAFHQQQSLLQPQAQLVTQNGSGRPGAEGMGTERRPMLYLLSLNGSFERKTISVPYYPETLRIGRQTNAKTLPTPINGYFDSKVLSRQHAEIWSDANGKIWIRDVKSSNGTFVNGTRLSPENRDSEPHELQTQDHLELGIDIVSEDQKTVVHHKVAAKVEHAGFVTPTSNVMDMNFGDLDPSSSSMMLPLGSGVSPFRGRAGSQPGVANGNRMAPGAMVGQPNALAQQRQFWLNPVTTEHIVKKLHTEMRNARLQNQDLARTNQFLNTLLSKEDVRNGDKHDAPEPPKAHLPNGNISFRSDGGKTRFSEPPAPPPSQPLPEKPDAARPSDAPSLKRATTERPKPASTSPIRPDNNNLNQILLLTEALNSAKKELDSHTSRVRDLEEMLTKEREARLQAEDMMQKLEESHHAKTAEVPLPLVNGTGHSELDNAFDPPADQQPQQHQQPSSPTTTSSASLPHPNGPESEPAPPPAPSSTSSSSTEKSELLAAAYQARIDAMAAEMHSLREQLEAFRLRAERAEVERDADRKTLAEMVLQIRRRDEEERVRREAEAVARERRRGRSGSSGGKSKSGLVRGVDGARGDEEEVEDEGVVMEGGRVARGMNGGAKGPEGAVIRGGKAVTGEREGEEEEDGSDVASSLSRAATMKPNGGALAVQGAAAAPQQQDAALIHTLPYASMIGVVLFGMGLMAYLNGWQPQPRLER